MRKQFHIWTQDVIFSETPWQETFKDKNTGSKELIKSLEITQYINYFACWRVIKLIHILMKLWKNKYYTYIYIFGESIQNWIQTMYITLANVMICFIICKEIELTQLKSSFKKILRFGLDFKCWKVLGWSHSQTQNCLKDSLVEPRIFQQFLNTAMSMKYNM